MQIIFPFSGTSIGGSNLSSLILINYLIKKNIKVKILLHQKGRLSEYLDNNLIKYDLINRECYNEKKTRIKNILTIISFIIFGIKFLYNNKKSIIHFNEFRVSFTWIIPLLFFNNVIIIHARSLFFKSTILNIICDRANQIISISKFVQKSFPIKYNRKIIKINNPVISTTCYNKNKFISNFNLNKNLKTICYISNFKHMKRPLLYLDIAFKLQKLRSDVQFLMFGNFNKSYEQKIKDKINDLKLKSKLQYFSFQKDINSIISNSDIVVLPGVNEPAGRIALECFINKTLVIASNSGGYKETIKNDFNGYLSNVDDANSFATDINVILNHSNSKKNNIIDNALKIVSKKYSIENHYLKIMKIYKSI